MDLSNLVRDLKPRLSDAGQQELDRLLVHPEVKKIQARDEEARLKERKAQIAELAALPKRYAAEQERAVARAIKAVRRHESAEAELRSATADMYEAQAAASAVDMQQRNAQFELEKNLLESSDRRLWEYQFYLRELLEKTRIQSRIVALDVMKNILGQKVRTYETNAHQIQEARDAMLKNIADLEAMRFLAVSRDDVTKTLTAMSRALAPRLVPFGLTPPSVSDLGVEMKWGAVPSQDAAKAAMLDAEERALAGVEAENSSAQSEPDSGIGEQFLAVLGVKSKKH